jgi:hypothetical protein
MCYRWLLRAPRKIYAAPYQSMNYAEVAAARGQALAELVRRALADLLAAADAEHQPDRLAVIAARLSAIEGRKRRGLL